MKPTTQSKPLFTVYHSHEGTEFTGTDEECQNYIAGYGGGWTALNTRPATSEEIEEYNNKSTPQPSDRDKALQWWAATDHPDCLRLINKYFKGQDYHISEDQIEDVWRQETQQGKREIINGVEITDVAAAEAYAIEEMGKDVGRRHGDIAYQQWFNRLKVEYTTQRGNVSAPVSEGKRDDLPEKITLLVTGSGRRTNEREEELLFRTDSGTLHFQKLGKYTLLPHALIDRYNSYQSLKEQNRELLEALQGIVGSWDKNGRGDKEEYKPENTDTGMPGYWSPSAAMVDSEFIANARKAIEKK